MQTRVTVVRAASHHVSKRGVEQQSTINDIIQQDYQTQRREGARE